MSGDSILGQVLSVKRPRRNATHFCRCALCLWLMPTRSLHLLCVLYHFATMIDINEYLVHPWSKLHGAPPCLSFPSGTTQKRVCGWVWEAYCPNAPLEECGKTRCERDLPWGWRIFNQKSQHILKKNGFLTSLRICSIVLAHIQVKMPVQIKRQTALLSSLIFTEHLWRRKNPLGS